MLITVELLTIARLFFGLGILLYASYTDIKTRIVENTAWFLMLGGGIALLEIHLFIISAPPILLLHGIVIIIFFITMFTEGEIFIDYVSKRTNALITLLINLIAFLIIYYEWFYAGGEDLFIYLMEIPLMIVIYYIFYRIRIFYGGADAKAFMSLAVLLPFYPKFYNFPAISIPLMEKVFPFSLVVLCDSVLILVILYPVGFLIYNAVKGDWGIPMFYCYKVNVDTIENKFVWLAERIVNGKRKNIVFPQRIDDEEEEKKNLKMEIENLKNQGLQRVWVTPQIPFIVPVTVGYVFSFLVGNILLYIPVLFL